MGKLEKYIIVAMFLVLTALLLVSSTDWIIKEDAVGSYRLSVIVNDSREDYWENYKKGMEKAAVLGNMEINFITITSKGDILRQMELIREEVKAGTDAIIISPTDSKILSRYLNEFIPNIPIITIGADVAFEQRASNVGPDYYQIGVMLADTIAKVYPGLANIMAFAYTENKTNTRQMYEGLQTLNSDQYDIKEIYCDDKVYMGSYLASKMSPEMPNILVCLDPYTMEFAIELFEHGDQQDLASIYGVGYTNKILHYLETKRINGLVVYSEYELGYRSVEQALDILNKEWDQNNVTLTHQLITGEELYQEEIAQLLFPKS